MSIGHWSNMSIKKCTPSVGSMERHYQKRVSGEDCHKYESKRKKWLLKLRDDFVYEWTLGSADKIQRGWRKLVKPPFVSFVVVIVLPPGRGTATTPPPPPASCGKRFPPICGKKSRHLPVAQQENTKNRNMGLKRNFDGHWIPSSALQHSFTCLDHPWPKFCLSALKSSTEGSAASRHSVWADILMTIYCVLNSRTFTRSEVDRIILEDGLHLSGVYQIADDIKNLNQRISFLSSQNDKLYINTSKDNLN